MHTYQSILDRHDVEVPAHLEQQAGVPVLAGMQRQGDVFVLPCLPGSTGEPVPPAGVAVVRGESGGNTHLLVADGPVRWRPESRGVDLGVVTVSDGGAAYLLHPEHGAQGIAPGSYLLRRQREQADEIRLVAD